ncbi:MAG: hypothetical protein WA949_16075 [Phormidesmis sp.]
MKHMALQSIRSAFVSAFLKMTVTATVVLGLVFTSFVGNAMAYNIDYGMDQARGEKTIEYYGEPLREIVEQTMQNNVNHPQPKSTSQNSYKRESKLNNLLPERRGKAFSLERFLSMRQTSNPNK